MNEYATGGIPVPVRAEEDNILKRRWEADQLLDQIYLSLTGNERQVLNGRVQYSKIEGRGILNEQGAERVLFVIKCHVNPASSLSNVDDADARTKYDLAINGLLSTLAAYPERYGVQHVADLEILKAGLTGTLFDQLMRSVDGFEARNSKTQHIESENKQTVTQSSGFKLPSFGGR